MSRPVAQQAPPKLDKEALMDYAGLLADDIIACVEGTAEDEQFGQPEDHPELLRSSYGVNAAGSDERVDVAVVVSSELKEGGKPIVASMVRAPATVEVVVNSAHGWDQLLAERESFVRSLYACLERELTSIAEDHREDEGASYQDFADEALARAEDFKRKHRNGSPTRDMMLDHVHSGEAFKNLLGLGTRERAKALKSVYSTLVDAGLV